MASERQRAAARRNVKKAQAGAKAKTRKELNEEAARLEIRGRAAIARAK
jgi:hypothetical protein